MSVTNTPRSPTNLKKAAASTVKKGRIKKSVATPAKTESAVDTIMDTGKRSSRSRKTVNYAPPPLDPLKDPKIQKEIEEIAKPTPSRKKSVKASPRVIAEEGEEDIIGSDIAMPPFISPSQDSKSVVSQLEPKVPKSAPKKSIGMPKSNKSSILTVKNEDSPSVSKQLEVSFAEPALAKSARKRTSSTASLEVVSTTAEPAQPKFARKRRAAISAPSAGKKARASEYSDGDVTQDEITSFVRSSRSRTSTPQPGAPSMPMHNVRVMFTGLPDDQSTKKFAVIEKLGALKVDDWKECTHLVTDKVRRTVKFLCALSAGKPIVSLKWIDACKKESRRVLEHEFFLKDATSESTWNFKLAESLKIAQSGARLFEGLIFYTTGKIKPERHDLKEMIVAAGGSHVDKIPKNLSDNPGFVVVGCQEDIAECKKIRDTHKIDVHTTEFLFSGILRQKVDYEGFLMLKKKEESKGKKRKL